MVQSRGRRSTMNIALLNRASKRECFRSTVAIDPKTATLADLRNLLKRYRWYKDQVEKKKLNFFFVVRGTTVDPANEAREMLCDYYPRLATMSAPERYLYNFRDCLRYWFVDELVIYVEAVADTAFYQYKDVPESLFSEEKKEQEQLQEQDQEEGELADEAEDKIGRIVDGVEYL